MRSNFRSNSAQTAAHSALSHSPSPLGEGRESKFEHEHEPQIELSPPTARSELERTGWLVLAEVAREVFAAKLVHLETDRLSVGRPGDQARPGESEPVPVIF